MRVHKQHILEGELTPGVFQDHGGGMSTNWTKYCVTAEDCRAKAKSPVANGVLRFLAGPMRSVPMELKHTPLPSDRSHVDVIGLKKSTEVRLRMLSVVELLLLPTEL
jgi:hypothetical protein